MKYSHIISYIIRLPLIFLFFPATVLFLSETSYISLAFLTVIPISIFLLLIQPNRCIKKFKFLFKHTPFRYFTILYIWIFISGLMAVVYNYYSLSRYLYVTILGFGLRFFLPLLYVIYIIPRYISLKQVIKTILIIYNVIVLIGFIEFIGALLNINIILDIMHLISNIRPEDANVIIEVNSGIPRIRSVFMEPGVYAKFIAINLPLIFFFAKTKLKIFNNPFLNIYCKRSLPILFLISAFLTQSPIYLIFISIILLVYFGKNILKYIIKHFSVFVSFLIILIICIIYLNSCIDLSKTYVLRIINVLETIPKMSLDSIVVAEPSLGTRIVNNYNQFCIFLKHPLWGVGFMNTGSVLIKQLMNSPVILTAEMQMILASAIDKISITTNAMYSLLYQTGLIGFIIYCVFIIKSINKIEYARKYCNIQISKFIQALKQSIIILFSLSIIYNKN